MIVIDTIRQMIDHKHDLRAWCKSCRHNQQLDLEALGQRLGFDHSTMHDALVPKLRCSACGSKDIGLIDSPRWTGPDR